MADEADEEARALLYRQRLRRQAAHKREFNALLKGDAEAKKTNYDNWKPLREASLEKR